MKKLLLFSSLLASCATFGQDIVNDYSIAVEAMEQRYPGYARAVQKTYEKNLAEIQAKGGDTDETYVVRVVMHIVWKEEVENLSDELVEGQMAMLNAAYSRTNEDADEIREVFEPVAGNPNIQFILEEVVRVETEVDFEVQLFSGELVDAVKRTDDGGSDAWDPSQYLNIWVVNVQGDGFFVPDDGLLGYAYPPADLENWPPNSSAPEPGLEGVVLHYKAFGPNNPTELINPATNEPMVIEGKTCVHEVAHFLGIRHVSGDPFGGDGCSVDDGLEDTPNVSAQSNFDCNHEQNTCDEGEDDRPDMVENFMDYSAESCQNSFTESQAELMNVVLQTSWPGLITSVEDKERIDVKLMPNPTTGVLKYSIPTETGRVNKVQLLDQTGRMVREVLSPNGVLDFSDVNSGLYFLSFEIEGNMHAKRIIIQ